MSGKLSRSENMSRIRRRDTRPEITLRKALWRAGHRYRLDSDLPGSPDLVFRRPRVAIFVDGCFWHGCPIHYSAPSTRFDFWAAKLKRNVEHDSKVDEQLRALNWRPVHAWQHELRAVERVVEGLIPILESEESCGSRSEGRLSGFGTALTILPCRTSKQKIPSPWFQCNCGSHNARVLAVSGPGSLRPMAQRRPDEVELICFDCRSTYRAKPVDAEVQAKSRVAGGTLPSPAG